MNAMTDFMHSKTGIRETNYGEVLKEAWDEGYAKGKLALSARLRCEQLARAYVPRVPNGAYWYIP